MNEAEFNGDLTALFRAHGWAHKIQDPNALVATSSSKRPFDGIARFKGFSYYYESKLIKHTLGAFAKSLVEDHQFENLLELRELGAETAIILGFWIPRKDYWFMTFDVDFFFNLPQKSILKKQLEKLLAQGKAFNLRKLDEFDPQFLIANRISALPE